MTVNKITVEERMILKILKTTPLDQLETTFRKISLNETEIDEFKKILAE